MVTRLMNLLKYFQTSLKERYTTGKQERAEQAEFNQRLFDRCKEDVGHNIYEPILYYRDQDIIEALVQQENRMAQILGIPFQNAERTVLDVSPWEGKITFDVAPWKQQQYGYIEHIEYAVRALCHPSRNPITGNGIFRDGDTPEECVFPDSTPDRVEAIPAPNWPVRIPIEAE